MLPGRDKQFLVTLPDEERVAWMWAILAAYAIPEIGTFIRSVRICFFKTSKKPSSAQFIVVSQQSYINLAVPSKSKVVSMH